jgi:hypothetical protein
MEKLFLVHLGFYSEISNGIHENHINIFVVASDFADAKEKAKSSSIVKENKMHIDGIQLIEVVSGFHIELKRDKSLNDFDKIINYKFRELAQLTLSNQDEV